MYSTSKDQDHAGEFRLDWEARRQRARRSDPAQSRTLNSQGVRIYKASAVEGVGDQPKPQSKDQAGDSWVSFTGTQTELEWGGLCHPDARLLRLSGRALAARLRDGEVPGVWVVRTHRQYVPDASGPLGTDT